MHPFKFVSGVLKYPDKAVLNTRCNFGGVIANKLNIMDTCHTQRNMPLCCNTERWNCSVYLLLTKSLNCWNSVPKMNIVTDNKWLTQFSAVGLGTR